MIIIPDSNCWRGELELLEILNQARANKICRIASSYIIARECGTADTVGLSRAALQRVLTYSDCWLRGRDEMMRGVVSYINYGWLDEITTEVLPYEEREERRYWNNWLAHIEARHEEALKFKDECKIQWTDLAQENRTEFIEQSKKLGVNIDQINENELRDYFRACFDPENLDSGGIFLDEILEDRGLEKHRIREVLEHMDQFPGLRLSYGHMLLSFLSQIVGNKIDQSFILDSLILLPVSSSSIFVTRDKNILKTARALRMVDQVQKPEEIIGKLKLDPRYNQN